MNVKEIVKKWLEENGCDGLCNSDIECGCGFGNLMNCDEPSIDECEAATRALKDGCEWYIPRDITAKGETDDTQTP